MLNEELKTDKNEVILKGEIFSLMSLYNKQGEKKGYLLTLKVDKHTFPQVLCFGESYYSIIDENYFVGDRIALKCNIQSSLREINGEKKISVSLFCDKVMFCNRIASKEYCKFSVCGEVIKTVTKNNKLKILLKTYISGRLATAFFEIHDYDERLHNYEKGQRLFLEGRIVTKKKFIDNERKYFTDYIIEKIKD